MVVNVKKTKVMVLSRSGNEGCSVRMNGTRLELVKEFKYLGSVLQSNCKVNKEIESRVNAGAKILGATGAMVRGGGVARKAKANIFKSLMVPALTYASETWAWQAGDMSRIQACEMRYLRAMCGVTRRDRIRNENVRMRSGMEESVAVKVGRGRLRWYGHLERMSGERVTKKIYRGEVLGLRPQGRPRFRWMDCVRKDLREWGMNEEEARVRAQDRKLWRGTIAKKPTA